MLRQPRWRQPPAPAVARFLTTPSAAWSSSSIFSGCLPPASAKSGRPPPRPPTIGASSRTTSPAFTRPVTSGVTLATICTLPPLSHAITTTPLLICALSESARPRSASLSRSATRRRASLTPPPPRCPAPPLRHLPLHLRPPARESFAFGLQPLDRFDRLLGRRVQRIEQRPHGRALLLRPRHRARPRECFDSAHACGDAALGDDDEEPDVAGRAHVRPTAELHAEARDAHDADLIAVLLAEQRHRAGGDRFLRRSHLGRDRRVARDLLVHDPFDAVELGARHR